MSRAFFVLLAWTACAAPAGAEPKAYAPLEAAYDRGVESDPALARALESLRRAVAEKNLAGLDALLSQDLVALECGADPTKPCTPAQRGLVRSNPKLRPPLRLLQALCCRDLAPARISKALREQTALGLIGGALEEESVGAHALLPGLACLPAWPKFDAAKAAAIAEAADIDREDLRVVTREMALFDKPAKGAAEQARLAPGQIAPLVTAAPEALPDGWIAIALPQGGLGYSDTLGLGDLTPAGFCLAKNPAGGWEIALTIQRRS